MSTTVSLTGATQFKVFVGPEGGPICVEVDGDGFWPSPSPREVSGFAGGHGAQTGGEKVRVALGWVMRVHDQ